MSLMWHSIVLKRHSIVLKWIRMAMNRDPETLKIPAFMRKRSISSRLKRPLILTALDRKKAGLPPDGLNKKNKTRVSRIQTSPRTVRTKLTDIQNENNLFLALEILKKQELKKRSAPKRKTKISSAGLGRKNEKLAEKMPKLMPFSEPLLPASAATQAENVRKPKEIGAITHYFDKIKVGVIKLTGALAVGDFIFFETPDGEYQQIVDSMEIDRSPVFKAGRGKEIGIKLSRPGRVGGKVKKI